MLIGHFRLKKATATAFYRVMHRMADVALPENVGDFRLMSRRVVAGGRWRVLTY